ncbi:unnamed protein product, partial [Brassica rapa]
IYNLSVPKRFSSSPELPLFLYLVSLFLFLYCVCFMLNSNPERNTLLLVHIVLSQVLINIANRSFIWMIG